MMSNGIRKVTPLMSCFDISHHYLFLQVLYQCALEKDLDLFEAGDKTEVGEKGLTLRYVFFVISGLSDIYFANSGGQKVAIFFFIHVDVDPHSCRLASPLLALSIHQQRPYCWTTSLPLWTSIRTFSC